MGGGAVRQRAAEDDVARLDEGDTVVAVAPVLEAEQNDDAASGVAGMSEEN